MRDKAEIFKDTTWNSSILEVLIDIRDVLVKMVPLSEKEKREALSKTPVQANRDRYKG